MKYIVFLVLMIIMIVKHVSIVTLGVVSLIMYVIFFNRRSINPPNRKPLAKAQDDAKNYGCEIPSRYEVQELLNRVYRKYDNSIKKYPNIGYELDEVMDCMWQNLVVCESVLEWKSTIFSVLRNWPDDGGDYQEKLASKLHSAKIAADLWRESQQEVVANGGRFGKARI